jgi:thymidylate synthase
MNKEEHQYLDLVKEVIESGYHETGRNGKTRVKFGHTMRFSLYLYFEWFYMFFVNMTVSVQKTLLKYYKCL